MNQTYNNWLESMNFQVDFYKKSFKKQRVDKEFDWAWYNSQLSWKEKLYPYVGPVLNFIRRKPKPQMLPFTKQWLNAKSEQLWASRQLLDDELSKLLFDSHLLLNIVDFSRYYFPRIDYDDLITIKNEEEFVGDLPREYLGLPLKTYSIKLSGRSQVSDIKVVTTKLQIDLLNNYRQYFARRGTLDFSPKQGEVVFDCGSCIGDISIIFAAFTGSTGQVHLFDPVPLHGRYGKFQGSLNPNLSQTLHVTNLAVGETTSRSSGTTKDASSISPSGRMVDDFETTSLDDYVSKNGLQRADYIKMDIEGYEQAALRGASRIMREFKPKLAISTYHRDSDLWEIPALILKLNPEYKIYFGHHSPKYWESVYYAV